MHDSKETILPMTWNKYQKRPLSPSSGSNEAQFLISLIIKSLRKLEIQNLVEICKIRNLSLKNMDDVLF